MFHDLLRTVHKMYFSCKNCGDKLKGIQIGLAPWIRNRVEVKSRIQIRIETNCNTPNVQYITCWFLVNSCIQAKGKNDQYESL